MSARGKINIPISIGIAFAVLLYIFIVSAAIVMMSPGVAIILGVLPFVFLFSNQSWDFDPSIRVLHWLFVSSIVLFVIWPRYLAFNFGGPDITPARIAYGLLLVFWAISLLSPSYRKDLVGLLRAGGGWVLVIALYVLLRVISCMFSIAPFQSIYLLLNELLAVVLVFPIALSIYHRLDNVSSLVAWLFFAGIVVASLAIIEVIVGHTLFANISLPGMKVDSEWLEQAVMDKVRAGRYRAQSTFSHPLLLAEFMIFEIPLAMYFMAHRRLMVRLIGVFAFALFVGGAVATGSRSSLVAIPIMILLAMALFSMRQRNGFAGGILWIMSVIAMVLGSVVLLVLLYAGVLDIGYFTGKSALEMSSTNARVLMLTRGFPLIADHPLFGYGIGMGGYILGINKAFGAITIDNYYLSLALDSGVPSMIVFIVAFCGFSVKGYLASFNNTSPHMLLAGMLAVSVIGVLIVKTILSIPHNGPLLYLSIAIIALISWIVAKKEGAC